jgi:hypothetical protein
MGYHIIREFIIALDTGGLRQQLEGGAVFVHGFVKAGAAVDGFKDLDFGLAAQAYFV